MKKVLFVFGTRPEAIKMAPLIKAFQNNKDDFETIVCVTAQHREMLDPFLEFFDIETDYDLNLASENQTLFDITKNSLLRLEKIIDNCSPDLILTHGDTTTAFMGSLSGYYKKIKVGHVEAGLRSHNKYSPFPEEMNRKLIDHICDYRFAPTERTKKCLWAEGIKDGVWVVGNTVIDALFLALEFIKEYEKRYFRDFNFIDFSKKVVLVTGHRRENFGEGLENVCFAIKEIADSFKDTEIVYPVHLNPNVLKPVNRILKNVKNVHLIKPLDYPHLVWLMNKSYFVITDSGGIQEEAPSLGKPVLVTRDVTERIEGIKAKTAKLVGTVKEKIVKEMSRLLTDEVEYKKMSKAKNPYGDGKASTKILKILKENLI